MVRDVITVRTVWSGLQIWRSIQMADSQLRKIRSQRRHIVKIKIFAELNSVRRARNHYRFLPYLLDDFDSACFCAITYTAMDQSVIDLFSPGSTIRPPSFAALSVCSRSCHSSPSIV